MLNNYVVIINRCASYFWPLGTTRVHCILCLRGNTYLLLKRFCCRKLRVVIITLIQITYYIISSNQMAEVRLPYHLKGAVRVASSYCARTGMFCLMIGLYSRQSQWVTNHGQHPKCIIMLHQHWLPCNIRETCMPVSRISTVLNCKLLVRVTCSCLWYFRLIMADESVTEQMKDLKMDEKKVSDIHAVSWLASEVLCLRQSLHMLLSELRIP